MSGGAEGEGRGHVGLVFGGRRLWDQATEATLQPSQAQEAALAPDIFYAQEVVRIQAQEAAQG